MTHANEQHFLAPAVSVILPVYNAQATLERSVASVLGQSFEDWELLLIEDGSQDGSAELCARLAVEEPRIRLLRQEANTGAAAARNAGLRQARGRYVAFLDADDIWLPEKLQKQIGFMQETGTVFSYTGFWRQQAGGSADQTLVSRHRVRVPAAVTRAQLLRGNVIGCLTAVYDQTYFGPLEMPPLRMRQDFAFWLLLLSRCPEARGMDEPLAVHYVTPHSLSSAKGRAMRATWDLYRRHLGLPAGQALWYMSSHLLRRLLRG
ncbi:glycosyltransferase family 2 protein [Phaeobacter sp. B1627]|uniref:glycosyltransferase family 2 protein n=1 Tax=Phaeobacter sp. B1627 TaxID=2583809 RepID=UPI00111AA47D|nr:glycosyltransferase family 2 protein [Phaeobacter sp. B1627]TNJ40946.1 glycosyltransferase family 2 protein [Phaeobacter sp. B1627]